MNELNPQTVEDINKRLYRLTSFRFNFLISLVRGVGITLGATLVASAVVAFLSMTIRTIYDVPVLGNILQSLEIEQVLQDSQR